MKNAGENFHGKCPDCQKNLIFEKNDSELFPYQLKIDREVSRRLFSVDCPCGAIVKPVSLFSGEIEIVVENYWKRRV